MGKTVVKYGMYENPFKEGVQSLAVQMLTSPKYVVQTIINGEQPKQDSGIMVVDISDALIDFDFGRATMRDLVRLEVQPYKEIAEGVGFPQMFKPQPLSAREIYNRLNDSGEFDEVHIWNSNRYTPHPKEVEHRRIRLNSKLPTEEESLRKVRGIAGQPSQKAGPHVLKYDYFDQETKKLWDIKIDVY